MRVLEHRPAAQLRRVPRADGEIVVWGQCPVPGHRFGSTPATALPGCFSTIAITGDGVLLTADPVGQFPLFHVDTPAGTVFGTRAAAVAGHADRGVDPVQLVTAVLCPEVQALSADRTVFQDVHRVAEGHLAHITPSGIRHSGTAPNAPDYAATFADYAERLRMLLTDAVAARAGMAGLLTADLSGGLDSTAIAFLASRYTAELPVFTQYDPSVPADDDIAHAHAFARLERRLVQHVVTVPPDHMPYTGFLPGGDQPHPSALAMGPLRHRLRAAAATGSTAHLVGDGGDLVLMPPPAFFADLARRGEFTRLWQHCTAWGRLRHRPPVALFRRAVLVGATPPGKALSRLAAAVERGHPVGVLTWEQDVIGRYRQPPADWLTPTARAGLAAHIRDTADRLPDGPGVEDTVMRALVRSQTLTQSAVRDTGAEFGVDVHAPFLDTGVVQTCLAVPAHERADPRQPKPLLRAALAGAVPDVVFARRTKGDYTADNYRGLRSATPRLRRLLADPVLADLGLFRPEPLRAALAAAVDGLPVPWAALNPVLAAEMWLRAERGAVTS